MASSHPDERRPANGTGDSRARVPPRTGGADHPTHAEQLDSYTYYAELLIAVDGHSLSLPRPRVPVDDPEPDPRADRAGQQSGDDLVARFDDTWT